MNCNTTLNTAALIATMGISSIALGDFSGFRVCDGIVAYQADGQTEAMLDDAAFVAFNIYADFTAPNTHGFNNADTHVLSIFNANFDLSNSTTGYLHHSDLTGSGNTGDGSWKPSFSFDVPGTSNSNIDSFITIGGGVGAEAVNNLTAPDPNFGEANSGDIFNADVGWFLNPPINTQGDVDAALSIWVGRFVVTGDDARNGANLDFSASIGYNYGEGTGSYFQEGSGNINFLCPTPSAIAFMGIGGTFLRRRRR